MIAGVRDRGLLFPDGHRVGQAERVAAAWDLSWPVPVPKFHMVCPACAGQMVFKDWKFHKRDTGSAEPWRCDVRLKCIVCSHVPIYGIPVPEAMFVRANKYGRAGGWINWRAGKRLLADAGFFD